MTNQNDQDVAAAKQRLQELEGEWQLRRQRLLELAELFKPLRDEAEKVIAVCQSLVERIPNSDTHERN